MNILMIGPFGMRPRMTMRARALPLAKALTARGHTVTLLLPPWQNPADAGKEWEEDGVRVENVTLPAGVPGWFHASLTSRLVRRTRDLAPDIVHAFKPKAYAGLAHLALNRRYPVVVDTDDWEGPGGWNTLADYPRPLRWFFTWQERWGLRHAAAVTVASRALQTLAWATGVPPQRVFYLPNGVELGIGNLAFRISNRPTLLLYTRFYIFEMARLWRVLELVRARRPEVQVYVVGKGFAGEEAELLRRARDAGWQVADTSQPGQESAPSADADLVYAGFVAPEELPRHLARGDLALYLFEDTLVNRTKCPVKLLELLAAGVPVVADAVGQLAEVVREGVNGRLVPSGNAEAFAATVLDLLDDREALRALGKRARADIATRYAWPALAPIAEAAYAYATKESMV